MKKRILSILLLCCMVLTLLPTAAFAAGEIDEQFTLAPGGTYYFDLSAMGIPGTVNDALPDKTMRYVPFTYAGTVDAYKLTSAMAATDEYAETNKYAHSLFVADYTVTHTVSWDELNAKGLIFGKNYTAGGVSYTLRAPSVGSDSAGSGDSQHGTPQSNEWDRILDKNDGYIKNWSRMHSWGQDISRSSWTSRAVRGYTSARYWNDDNAAYSSPYLGFRPVLEILNPGTLGSDGLKAVTLDLGGGKLGGSSEDIQTIVKKGSEFTAPASDGLTRPEGNTDSYFQWLGSDGKLYAPGDSVPADVIKLTAQFDEQFTLTPGGVYYFDLSGVSIPGTANGSLPDKTMHYVPFTYAGTVDAYKLTSEMATTEEYAQQNEYAHSLFVADYAVTHAVSWDNLNAEGLIFGKGYATGSVDYTLRAPSGGSGGTGSGALERGTPQSNEWDRILDKDDGYIKNCRNIDSWGQDTLPNTLSNRVIRGQYDLPRKYAGANTTLSFPFLGFRPVLEVLNPGTLGSDGLKAVTLDLGGGKLGDKSSIRIIVKNGSEFTAPASDGLTRPEGATGNYFKWLGSDDKLYAPGDSVPADVTTLTARFVPDTYTVIVTTDTLPDGKTGKAYSHTLTAISTAPITWSIDSGALPAGLNLNRETGEISGIPTAAGTATFTVKAENSEGSDTRALSIIISNPVEQTPVRYLDADGKERFCTEYTVLESVIIEDFFDSDNKWYDMPAGWYVVEGDVTITPRLDTHGAVNLILKDDCHLTVPWGINVKEGDTFTIYAQSTAEASMGKLTACLPELSDHEKSVWPVAGLSGIGAGVRVWAANDNYYENEGTIIINGGNIHAKGQQGSSAIGGSDYEHNTSYDGDTPGNLRQGGSITINGGIVCTELRTSGGAHLSDSFGIGTCGGNGGSVTINGGTIIAEASSSAISSGRGGSITINGGNVTAHGGINRYENQPLYAIPGNGIGSLEGGSITINGGTVKASSEGDGFGIGGAGVHHTAEMHITINGGNIETTANRNNAAIGDKSKHKSSVTITGGVIHAVGKGSAAGIGSTGDIRITGGEISVFAEGGGAAIGSIGGVDCKSITINGNVIKSISSKDGACIGGTTGGSVGSITISDAELPSLSAEKILIGWDADSPGGKLTIRNCRVESTDIPTARTDGIRVGSNSELVIEESEIRLPHFRSIRVGGNGSIAVRDSDLHTYGIFMDETVQSPNDAKTLKKLEITDSTVLTGDIIGARGGYSSVEEVVIHDSSIRLNDEYTYNYCTIGGGTNGSFGSIDIQNSQIHIPSSGGNTAIGNGWQVYYNRESRIRIANSEVSVRCASLGPAIGAAWDSGSGRINIIIENSTVTAKGGNLRTDGNYVPGIGKNALGRAPEIGIQILNSTVDSFRLTEREGTDYVYDDLHTKELPGIPAENISICGSTVNGKTIDHSFDEYGKCTLCGKYDLGYCYEHGLLMMEGLTDCVSDGSEKKLTGLSYQTGENETKQLAENMDYTAIYSNNVNPYTLTPDDAGFDPEKAPKVTLYGTGNYCGKAEHYFTISESTAAAPTITTDTLPNGKVGEAYSHTLTADGTTPITWRVENGDLPTDLSLNKDTGKISGTPTAAGSSTFTVKATNSAGSDTKELSITIEAVDPVELDPVPYLDADGKRQVCTEYTVLKSNTTNSILDLENKWYELPAGWYVVEGDVTITPRVDTQGEVNLILKDGSHLTAEWGINVKKGDTFTVYAQSTGEDTMGKLTACLPEDFNSDGSVDYVVWPDEGLSGIGGGVRWKKANNGIYESEGTIVINGGNIRARGQNRASAIGGTFQDHADVASSGYSSEKRLGGSITINGGIVRTEAITSGTAITAFNVGIGSCCSGYGGSVTINGGTVIANAASSAISTGRDGSITINGGTITATGGINNFTVGKDALILGNGIGPYWTGTVTVNGGKIKASTAGQGSGIGGSRSQTKVIINGGDIEAVADQYGTGQNGAESISTAGIGGVGSVSITGGRISATAIGGAAGIGGNAEISITGGEITVSATGTGAAIGGAAGKDCKSIHIQGDVLKSVSSVNGACIGAANGKGSGNITIANVKLSSLSGKNTLIGWEADSPESQLTIRNCRILSTDADTSSSTNGICVGKSSSILIEDSEIKLPQKSCIRADDGGSIVIRDSTIHSHGIYMRGDKNAEKKLKRLEITDSTVVTGDVIGGKGDSSSVDEIVIRSSNISLDSRDIYNRYSIGCGTNGSFGSIDIQNSTIDIPRGSDSAAIGSALGGNFTGESLIRIADSQVTVACLRRSPAIGAGVSSYGNGKLKIYIENSNVTAKGGSPKADDQYIPGIGRHGSADKPEVYIQILNSTVESFRHTKTGVEDDSDLVYDDLHIKELPGIPAENISICGSTVNGKTIDHSFDEYGKCTLCGKYDLGYCYEHGLLTLEGLTDCVSDGSEKKLTGLSHQTGENETKQLTENTDYTAIYSNNVHPYTLKPDDEGFDPEKAPKVTLYGTGNYCGKAEHYFTISESTAAAPTITTDTLPNSKVGEAYSHTLTADGTTPITWSVSGGALPEGLTLNETTGEISGTPTAEGTAKFTVKAENSAGSDTKELSITITKDAPPAHEHSYGDWRKDGTSHWHECTDTDCPNREESITDKAAHVYTDDTDTTCDVCGYERTVTPPSHEHSYGDWRKDGTSHWHECTDIDCPNREESITDKAAHVYTDDTDTTCDVCGYERTVTPPAPTEFIVTFDGNGGTPSVGSMTTTDQKLTSLPSASRSGSYSFDGWYTQKSGGTKITTDTVFSANTTVYAHWTYTGGGGGGYNPPVTYYTLRFETGGGSDIPSVRETYNAYIDLTQYVPTWRGHTFIGWYSERGLINKVSGVYLTRDMTVYAGWRVDENPNTGANPFTDVSEKDWFYGDVMFVYENGLMLGTSKTLFSPHGTATRGMMATILWRMEGSPVPKGKNSFTDVEAGKWYADAITWTAENSIFAGYGKDKFGPDDPITREQLAAIFYRYADYKGYDLTIKGNPDKFKDADKITDYAKTAMQWAVGSVLVKGKSGNLLDPQGTATRAEIAAMLHRFIEKYELVQGKAPGGLMGWLDPKRLKSQRPATAAC